MRRGRVDGEGEEVRRFAEVRHQSAVEDEVDEDEDVHGKDESKYEYPCFGSAGHAPGCILLGFERGVEVLRLVLVEHRVGIVLWFGSASSLVECRKRRDANSRRQRGAYPECHKRRIHHTQQ